MYLLDTDHIVILQTAATGEFARLVDRMSQYAAADFSVSIVSFHEQVLGWNAYISRAKEMAGLVRGYRRFHDLLEYFRDAQVLPFDATAAQRYEALRTARVRVPTMDLRIAAIALSRDLTVLTRNQVDFRRVPGLRVEDWTTQ